MENWDDLCSTATNCVKGIAEYCTPKDTTEHPDEKDSPAPNDIKAPLVCSHGNKEKIGVETETPSSCESNCESCSRDAPADFVCKTCTGNKSHPGDDDSSAVEATDNIILCGCMSCPSPDGLHEEPKQVSPSSGEILSFKRACDKAELEDVECHQMTPVWYEGVAVVLMVGTYPLKYSTKCTETKGTDKLPTMSYAGSGNPCMADAEDSLKYKTDLEQPPAMDEVVEVANLVKCDGYKTAVTGIIATWIAEMVALINGTTKLTEGRINKPTPVFHEPMAVDVTAINPYSFHLIQSTTAVVPGGHEMATNVHKAVKEEGH